MGVESPLRALWGFNPPHKEIIIKTKVVPKPESVTIKKVVGINGENAKGGFIKFEKSAKNIEFSVWVRSEILANIKVGSVLELETASIRQGVDKDGNKHPVRWSFTDKNTGEIRNLQVGQGTLDYRIKILKITTPKTSEVMLDIS